MKSVSSVQRSIKLLWVAVILAFVPSFSIAQEQNNITLRVEVGGTVAETISGELLSFEDGKFTVNSALGPLVIPSDGVSCVGDACPESTRLKITSGQMILTARDGSFTITGRLIEVVDDQYVVATSVGEMRVKTALVDCRGDGCDQVKPKAEFGGQVVLSNGATTLRGTLLGIVDGSYLLEEEALGTIRVKTERFKCVGAGCP